MRFRVLPGEPRVSAFFAHSIDLAARSAGLGLAAAISATAGRAGSAEPPPTFVLVICATAPKVNSVSEAIKELSHSAPQTERDSPVASPRRRTLQRKKRVWLCKKTAYLVLTRKSASHWNRQHVMANTTPITIKKYANRRLYNTASSAYVTLADLAKMVKAGDDVVVYDAKTNEDITRSVLTQIIFEQEGIEGQSLLPTTFLRQLIRFYGDSMQAVLPSYLEFSIDRFSGEQQAMREAASRMFGPEAFSAGSFAAIQELTKKNFAAFNQALAMFSPFVPATSATESAPKKANSEDDIDDLRTQLSDMQKRLETLAKKG
jgi:polyhydroxyalkanoate synthesis repressor PhaR